MRRISRLYPGNILLISLVYPYNVGPVFGDGPQVFPPSGTCAVQCGFDGCSIAETLQGGLYNLLAPADQRTLYSEIGGNVGSAYSEGTKKAIARERKSADDLPRLTRLHNLREISKANELVQFPACVHSARSLSTLRHDRIILLLAQHIAPLGSIKSISDLFTGRLEEVVNRMHALQIPGLETGGGCDDQRASIA
jgi:hypothetical protein